jgi:hypothetical protein
MDENLFVSNHGRLVVFKYPITSPVLVFRKIPGNLAELTAHAGRLLDLVTAVVAVAVSHQGAEALQGFSHFLALDTAFIATPL